MLLFLAAAFTALPPQPPSVAATATVRIERPVTVSGEEWKRLPKNARREVIVRDEQGRERRLRLVEMQ